MNDQGEIARDVEGWLARHERKESFGRASGVMSMRMT